ncbi:MAG: hypothetical protein GX922_08225, partial [Firmicutes bacterium]|nr:hypothetical protein [Bacillota bacterium]
MKRLKFLLFICYPFIYIGCSDKSNEDLKVNWVDPFIATEGDHGQLYPGATTPFGLVKLSPETTGTGHSGYQYQE